MKSNDTYYQYEIKYWNQKHEYIVGIDEAGRGSWAGPIAVAGCILPVGYRNDLIKDSKQLSIKQREELFEQLTNNPNIKYSIQFVPAEVVDKLNPKQATIEAMYQIIEEIIPSPTIALIDAEKLPKAKIKTVSIIKGDSKSISIAAASILAKVSRDRYMTQMEKKYPEFSFSKHKGYGTMKHFNELNKVGPIVGFHRFSYQPIQNVLAVLDKKRAAKKK